MRLVKFYKLLHPVMVNLGNNCDLNKFEKTYQHDTSNYFFHNLAGVKRNGLSDDYFHVYGINGKFYVTYEDLGSYTKFCGKCTILDIHQVNVTNVGIERVVELYQVDIHSDKCYLEYKKVQVGTAPLF